MAENDPKRGPDISQAGLTLFKSVYAMKLRRDSDGGSHIWDGTESDESRKQTSSIPSSRNGVEEKKKKGDKEEVGGSNRPNSYYSYQC